MYVWNKAQPGGVINLSNCYHLRDKFIPVAIYSGYGKQSRSSCYRGNIKRLCNTVLTFHKR